MLQIIQTRILSVVSLYYMAFFSISMAMLGLTAGALIVYFRLNQINGSNVSSYLSKISTAFALSVAFCFLIQLASPLMMVKWATLVIVWLKIIVLLAIPSSSLALLFQLRLPAVHIQSASPMALI
jgi:hypothetical protein